MGDLQIRVKAMLAEDAKAKLDSSLSSMIKKVESSNKIHLKVELDKNSVNTVQRQLQTIAKEVASASSKAKSGAGSLTLFDSKQLQADGRIYFNNVKNIVARAQKEFGKMGKVDITGVFKDAKGDIQSFSAAVTKADGTLEKFNFQLAKIQNGSRYMRGFVQMSSVLNDKNMGSGLERSLNFLNRIDTKIKDITSKTLSNTSKPLLGDMTQYDQFQAKLEQTKQGIEAIRRANTTLSNENKRQINSMVADLQRYAAELQKSAYAATDLNASTFSAKKEELQASLQTNINKWTRSGLFGGDFEAAVNHAKTTLDSAFDSTGLEAYKHELTMITEQFKQIKSNAAANNDPVKADTLQANIETARQRILNLKDTYSKFLSDPELSARWSELFNSSEIVSSQAELQKLNADIRLFEQDLIGAGSHMQAMWDSLKANAVKMGTWMVLGGVISSIMRGITGVYDAVVKLNTAMTELKKVTSAAGSTYDKFLVSAAKKSVELGTSYADYVNSTASFARLGYSIDDSSKLAEVANVYAVVGDEISGVDEATTSVISTLKAFGIEASNAMSIVDKFNAVGNNFAISSGGIGTALQNSASALATANNTLDQSIALIVAANNVIQNPEEVGNMWKTVSMRIRGAKTELEDAGLEVDGMAESTSKLRESIKQLTNVNGTGGFDIMLNEDTFKSTYDIVLGISKVWKDMSDINQASLLEMLAGKRQGNALSAAMTNMQDAEKVLKTSLESDGSAMREHEQWMDSIEAKQQKFQAQYEVFANTIMNSQLIKGAFDAGTGLLGFLTKITEKVGALPVLFAAVTPFIDKLSNSVFKSYTDLNGNISIGTQNKVSGLQLADDNSLLQSYLSKLTKLPDVSKQSAEYIAAMQQRQKLYNDTIAKGSNGLKRMVSVSQEANQITGKFGNGTLTAGKNVRSLGNNAAFAAVKVTLLNMAFNAAVGAVIGAAITGLTKFITATDRSREALSSIKDEYSSNETQLTSLNSQLTETQSKITDLKAKGKLSFTDNEELERLQAQNDELQREIDLLNTEQRLKKRELNKQFVKTMDTEYNGSAWDNIVDGFTDSDTSHSLKYFKSNLNAYSSYTRQLAELDVQYANDVDNKTYKDRKAQLEKWRSSEETTIQEMLSRMSDASEGIDYIHDPTTDDERAVNAYLDMIGDFQDMAMIAFGGSNSKTNALNRLTSHEFADIGKKLKELGKQGELTAEQLRAEEYQNFISKLIQLGVITDSSDESLENLATYFNETATAAEQAANSLSVAGSRLSQFKEKAASTISELSTVKELINKQTTGTSIDIESYEKLIEISSDYAACLEYQNGALQMNAEKMASVASAHAQYQADMIAEAKALDQAKYLQNVKELNQLRKALQDGDFGDSNDLATIRDRIDALKTENDTLLAQCDKYDLIAASIQEAQSAYQNWLNAKNASQTGDMFDGAMNAIKQIDDTLNNSDSDLFGRIGRTDYKAAVDFIIPDKYDREDADAVNSYLDSISSMFTFDDKGNRTGLNIANFCEKAVKEGLMVLDESGQSYQIAGKKTMEDFAKGLDLSLPLVQAMFGEMQEFGAKFDWADEAPTTFADLAVAATDAKEKLTALQDVLGLDMDVQIDVSDLPTKTEQVQALEQTIQKMQDNKLKLEVDTAEYENANKIIEYCQAQLNRLNRPVVMSVDTSMVQGKVADAISLLQQFVDLSNQIDINTELGLDTTDLQTQLQNVGKQIASLDESVTIPLNIETGSVEEINAAIAAIDKSPELLVQLGIDDSAIIGYNPEDKTVKYVADITDLPTSFDSVSRTVNYYANLSMLTEKLSSLTRWVYYKDANKPGGSGGDHELNGTAHAGGTARASGDWGTAPGGRTMVGELGTEIVVDPRTGKWYTVGDNGAEFVNIPRGAIVFNHVQSKSLLENGYVAGRGTAMVTGTAAVTGFVPINRWTPGSGNSGNTGNKGGGGRSSGGSNSSSSSSSSDEDKYNPFEEAYKQHQHMLKMEQEDLRSYLNWLQGAYQDAYHNGYIEHDDYLKYEEEVYEKSKDLFDDYLNDLEFRIEQLGRDGGNQGDIINTYIAMGNAINNQLAEAYRRGLSQNDDYVQKLIKKQNEYKDAIKDLQDDALKDAKSAVDDLVKYRIKMLKQDIENERDALKDRLDKLKDFYSEQKDLLKKSKEDEKYIEEQAEKRKEKADIEAQLAQLAMDDSAAAQKRRLKLQEDLSKADKSLTDFEKDHAYDQTTQFLDNMLKQQEDQINLQIEELEAKLNDPDALYNQALRDIQNNTERLYVAMVDYNNDYGDGNAETVKEMWDEAKKSLDDYLNTFGQMYKNILLVASNSYGLTGYASGTRSASSGLHKFDEGKRSEYVLAKGGDKYRMFSDGDIVLDHGSADFLYDFTRTRGGGFISKIVSVLGGACDGIVRNLSAAMLGSGNGAGWIRNGLSPAGSSPQISMGDIIIEGNADEKTVSEIRREQRDGMDYLLKELAKLNK